MFKRVGKELKNRAEGYVYWRVSVATLIAGIGGLVVFPLFAGDDILLIWGALLYLTILIGVPVITYFICRERAIRLYAFAQLVDDVQTIRECIEFKDEEKSAHVAGCFCSVCGSEVKENARFCSSCAMEL